MLRSKNLAKMDVSVKMAKNERCEKHDHYTKYDEGLKSNKNSKKIQRHKLQLVNDDHPSKTRCGKSNPVDERTMNS